MKFKGWIVLLLGLMISCNKTSEQQITENKDETGETAETSIITKEISYPINDEEYKSFVALDSQAKGEIPVVFILPEWWGITDYTKGRAEQIASLGYVAVVVDMFGKGGFVETPDEAKSQTQPIYADPAWAKKLFESAMHEVQKLPEANADKMAAIGYCFGGAMVLNYARAGEPLKGVVSFHGNLSTGVKSISNSVPMLVLNGADDKFISEEEIESFKEEMESAGVDYTFINYPDALHSFTNPKATEVGQKFGMNVAYNKEADEASFEEMKRFLASVFGE
ncbi:MAG: dienelactone hydrolase family protein [Weeksellaceae bacterium]